MYKLHKHAILSALPIIPPQLTVHTENNKDKVSWKLPIGQYSGLAVEQCQEDVCQSINVTINTTRLELDTGDRMYTYKLVVYQHDQIVLVSGPFEEVHLTDCKIICGFGSKFFNIVFNLHPLS